MFDEFVIFPWGRLERVSRKHRDIDAVLADIAACGFNGSPFVRSEEYDACRRAGLRIYAMFEIMDPWIPEKSVVLNPNLSDEEIVAAVKARLSDLPRDVNAVFIKDEPNVKVFGRIGLITDTVKKVAPGVEPYINLFPNYAICGSPDMSQLGTETYEEYLDRFAGETRAASISVDNYLIHMSEAGKEPDKVKQYFLNLIQAQDACKKHGIPFQHVISCNQLRSHLMAPTYTSLAYQAYTSLAAGAKAISWYLYFGWDYYGYSPIDDLGEEDVKTQSWYDLREVNRQIMPIGKLLFPMTFREMYFSEPDGIRGAHDAKELPLSASIRTNGVPYMIGSFDDHGTEVDLLVNTDFARSLRLTLDDAGAWEVYDGVNGRFRDILRQNREPLYSDLWVAPGCGVVIRRK